MSQNNWTQHQDEILIEFVRNHEFIYNIKLKDYKNAQLKQNIWCEIARILNRTDIDCSKRWAYIRDYYIRRRGKPGSSSEAVKKRYDLLSFLDNCPSTKSTITIIPGIVYDTDDTEETVSTERDKNAIEFTQNDVKPIKEEIETYDSEIRNVDNWLSSRKRKTSSCSEDRLKLHKQTSELQRQPIVSVPDEKDEIDHFFTAMAKIVKKLPQLERAQLRMQIGTLVGNAELKYLSSQREDSHSNSTATSSSSYDNCFLDITVPTICIK